MHFHAEEHLFCLPKKDTFEIILHLPVHVAGNKPPSDDSYILQYFIMNDSFHIPPDTMHLL